MKLRLGEEGILPEYTVVYIKLISAILPVYGVQRPLRQFNKLVANWQQIITSDIFVLRRAGYTPN